MSAKPEEWFRRTTWDARIAASFDERLRRSRATFHRAQYLRIQGLTLTDAGSPELVRIGMQLMLRVLDEYPDEKTEIARALCDLGTAHEKLGEHDDAIELYRKAWSYEHGFPNVETGARAKLAMLLVKQNRRADADEALRAVESISVTFPVQEFERHFVQAMVASWRGKTEAAARFAKGGLKAASATHSGLRYHATLGLVVPRLSAEVAALQRLVNDSAGGIK